MTTATHSAPSTQQSALALLMSRQSRWPLVAPAPSQSEINQVIDLALRAPDHGQLQPWRFVLVRGDARQALGEVFVQAAHTRDPQGDAERFRHKAMAAPLLIALGAHLQPGHKVPESEQLLAVGAAAMNMLNALHLLGYGGFWATGLKAMMRACARPWALRQATGWWGFSTWARQKKPRHRPCGRREAGSCGNGRPSLRQPTWIRPLRRSQT